MKVIRCRLRKYVKKGPTKTMALGPTSHVLLIKPNPKIVEVY